MNALPFIRLNAFYHSQQLTHAGTHSLRRVFELFAAYLEKIKLSHSIHMRCAQSTQSIELNIYKKKV